MVWKLFRLEVGLAGVAVGIGPLDIGLGVLFYEPRLPEFTCRDEHESKRERKTEKKVIRVETIDEDEDEDEGEDEDEHED